MQRGSGCRGGVSACLPMWTDATAEAHGLEMRSLVLINLRNTLLMKLMGVHRRALEERAGV